MDTEVLSTDEKLDVLMRAGALLLENGAAAYRVDETLTALGQGLGLSDIEIFAIPTGLILSAAGPEGARTKVSHLKALGVNMNRLNQVSSLAREAASLNAAAIAARLAAIEKTGSAYPEWMVIIGVALACGAFALLFGGGWREFAAASTGAALAIMMRLRLQKVRLVPFMVTAIAAFVATAASVTACQPLACTSPEVVPVAAVLQLVPGVPMVTWVIDLATGDILSGVTRAAYTAFMAMGIALGMLLFLIWGFFQ